jgi:hypothetical protein
MPMLTISGPIPLLLLYAFMTDPVDARSKAWVCGRSLTGIVGSNPTGGMDVCVVFVVRTVEWKISGMKDKKD